MASGDWTIETWVKPAVIDSASRGFIGSQNGAVLSRGPSLWVYNNDLHFDSYSSSGTRHYAVTSGTFFAANEWTHVAWVKNGTTYSLYRNGASFTALDLSFVNSSFIAPADASVGTAIYKLGAVDSHFNGALDETRIWNTARTQEAIQAGMYSRLNGTETGLVRSWDFEEPSGTTAYNHTSTDTHGTLTNFTDTTRTANSAPVAERAGAIDLDGTNDYEIGRAHV